MRLTDAIAGYWLDKKQRFSKRTIEAYERYFGYLVDYLNDMDFERITLDDIRRFLAHLASSRNLSRRSQHDAWVPLSSLWMWAEKEMGTPHIIRGRVEAPAYSDPVIGPLTVDDVRLMLEEAERSERPTAIRDRAIILVLLDSGIRASELCNLDISDYDERRGRLHVRSSKGDKSRYVCICNKAAI
jgi:site-specific recombinase XerD